VKVLDFGLAKALLPEAGLKETASHNAHMLGSPLYMSPEQMRGDRVDTRTDVWSMGATLYNIVAGVPPFDAPTLAEVAAAILMDTFPPIASRRPDAPADLEPLLRRCMDRDVQRRLGSIRELRDALRAMQEGRSSQPELPNMTGTVRMQAQSSPSWNVAPAAPPVAPHTPPRPRGPLPLAAFAGAVPQQAQRAPKTSSRAVWWAIIVALLLASAAIAGVAMYLTR